MDENEETHFEMKQKEVNDNLYFFHIHQLRITIKIIPELTEHI